MKLDRTALTGRAARLAKYLGQHTGIRVTEETVRMYLHAHDYGGFRLRDGWFDGRVAPERTADAFCERVLAAVARSKQPGRVAIVMTDHLQTHTSAGSLLVRTMLTELKEHLYLVYTHE